MELEAVLEIINTLTDAEKQKLIRHLQNEQAIQKTTKRILDLHPGAMRMSPDFDEELPDSFWFGEE